MKKTYKVKPKSKAVKAVPKTYEEDFLKWTREQAGFLKKKDFTHVDLVNLIEEIESLGISNKLALRSHLQNLLLHLLKFNYCNSQKGNSRSWESSIFNARTEIEALLEKSPSLKRELSKILDKAYSKAVQAASIETGKKINHFPSECPWELKEIMK